MVYQTLFKKISLIYFIATYFSWFIQKFRMHIRETSFSDALIPSLV